MKHTIVYLDDYDYLTVSTEDKTIIGMDAINYINNHTSNKKARVLEDMTGNKLVL